ncbi:MAG: hypothetical protein GYA36_21130 [Veillonellaceae bacterium]|nr:hypothetical protein [Veillonellaceae bacterium]
MIKGVDVYHGDGEINWSLVARQGFGFAYLKATEGTAWRDPAYARNKARAQGCQLLVGAYHYLKPVAGSGEDQAAHFLWVVGYGEGLAGMLPPAVDVEEAGKLDRDQMTALVREFSDEVRRVVSLRPFVYVSPSFAEEHLRPTLVPDHKLWVAHYTRNAPFDDPTCAPWGHWSFWQYTDKGSITGINNGKATTDLDMFNGSAAELAQLVIR